MKKPTIDSRLLVGVVIIAVVVVLGAWRITALPPGVVWWQAWPWR